MNDTLEMYSNLMMLKRMKPDRISLHLNLQQHIDPTSNNILVICRLKKDCKEAIKFIARDNLGKLSRVSLSSGILKIKDTTFKFVPVVDLYESIIGYKYKEYYFEEEFHIYR